MNSTTNGFGVAFASENRSMQDKDWQYRSDKSKLTVDPNQHPSHLQLFDQDGGTQWSISHGDSRLEILYRQKHNMPWPPMFLCYFFTADAPAASVGLIGLYALNQGLMRFNGDTWFEELYTEVDDTWFYIKHHVAYNGGVDIGAQVANGSAFKFRIRLEIIARKAVFLGGPSFT